MSSSDSISISLPFQQSLLTQPFLQLASLKGKPSFRGLVCSCQSQQRGSIKPRFPCPETQRQTCDFFLQAVGVPGPRCPVLVGRAAAEGAVPVLAALPALGASSVQGFPVPS